MPPTQHRHRSSRHAGTGSRGGQRDEVGHRGNRRSAANCERSSAHESRAPSVPRTVTEPAQRHGQRRKVLPDTLSSGPNASVLCVIFAFVGLCIVAVGEIIARANGEPTHPVFNLLAGACTITALAIGIYAQTTQMLRWSRRVKRRLLIGLPVALLNALMVTDNCFEKYERLGAPKTDKPARETAVGATLEDKDLVKPGWYGECQQDGLLLVATSFEDNAAETKRFCRRLFKPVSYATLSLINLNARVPVVLQALEVKLHMDSGEAIQSLAIKPLLEQKAGSNADLLQLLTVPHELATGAMLPDIPVCQQTNFPWAHVTAVDVSLSFGTLTIPGRLMTADEKQAMLDRTAASRPPGGTNLTAEAWFNNL